MSINNFPKITLRAARTNAKLSLVEASTEIGINFQTLSKYENDSSNIPVSLVNKLSELYFYPTDYIFLGKDTDIKRYNIKQLSSRSEPAQG
jgi:transcriptional regulator with XRE-family HTH domain